MHRRIIYSAFAVAVPIVVVGVAPIAQTTSGVQPTLRKVVQQQPQAWSPQVEAAAAPGDATASYGTTSAQIVSRTIIYEPDTSYGQAPTEIVTVDKWYAPLTTPTRRRTSLNDTRALTFAIQPQANDQQSWYQSLGEPLRLKRSLYTVQHHVAFPLQFLHPDPGSPGDATAGFGSTSAQLVNRTVIYEDGTTYVQAGVAAETITVDKWYAPLTTPTRRRTSLNDNSSLFAVQPQANDQIAWHRPLEAPTRAKRLPQGVIPGEARNAFPVVPWGWYAKLDEPTELKRPPQVALTFVAAAPGAGVAYNWFQSLDEPLRIKRSLYAQQLFSYANYVPVAAAAGDATAGYGSTSAQIISKTIVYELDAYTPYTPVVVAETITVDKWWRELDRPVRRQVVGDRAALTFLAAAPSNAVAQNWFLPLEIPTRARRLYEFPATAIPVYFVPPSPGAGNEFNWWPQLDEPIRPRPSIKTAQQWALTVPPRLLTTTLENAWFVQLAEPVRLKVTFGKYPGGAVQGDPFPPAVVLDWYSYPPLDIPTRKPWLNRSAGAQGNINPIVPLAWSSIDDPRRLRPRFNVSAGAQGNINPLVPFAHTFLFAPHRLKGRIDRPALAQGIIKEDVVEIGKFTQWWRQLDLPVREWRKVAWQWAVTVPPTGVSFFVEGGPADESERVACVPASSRTAIEPDLLRTAAVPVEDRTATVPELLRVVDVPDQMRTVNSNDYRDRPCHDT